MTPNCPHSRLVFLGIQEFPGSKPFRLYNCEDCHTTVSRHRYFRTEEEIDSLMFKIDYLRWYLSVKENPDTPEKNFNTLESLINEVSRAKSILSNAEGTEASSGNKA
jgi:hypothetical protein